MTEQKLYLCDYMDSGINFERWGIYVCCKTAHEGGGMLTLANSYDNLNWDEIFAKKRAWKQQTAVGNPPDRCKGCSSLVETDKLCEEDAFVFVDVNSFVRCNSKCCYCDCWSVKDFQEKSLYPIFKELLDKKLLKNAPHGYIQFAGGEPALMKDFEKIVDLCLKNGLERYIVNSNGIQFSKGIFNLLKKGKTNLFVSIDSGSRETYEKIKRVPCFDKVINNLRKYASAQKKGQSCVWLKYIIVPGYNDNFLELEKWYNLATKKLGIKAVVLDVEREWFKSHNRQITPEMEKMVEYIRQKCREDNIKLDYYEQLKCLYGIH